MGKSKCSYALSEMSYFYDLKKKKGTFGVRYEFCGTEGQLFKTHKPRTNGVLVCVCVRRPGINEILNMYAFLRFFYKESTTVYGNN